MAAMPDSSGPLWKPYAALFAGVGILGFSAIFTRLADAPGAVVSFYRMAIGTAVLAIPFAAVFRRHKPKLPPRGFWLAVLAGAFFGLDLASWATGINAAGATIPTLLGNLAPVIVGLGAWLLFKEDLSWFFWLGLAIALAGVVTVLGLDFNGAMAFNPGALFGLLSALFYGSYLLTAQKGRDQLSALSFFWIAAAASTLSLLVLILVLGNSLTGYPASTYLYFLALGVLVQGGGWMLINYAQGYLPASLVAPTLLVQPVLTAILAGPLLAEIFTLQQWLGGAAVILGIIVVYSSRRVRRLVAEKI